MMIQIKQILIVKKKLNKFKNKKIIINKKNLVLQIQEILLKFVKAHI